MFECRRYARCPFTACVFCSNHSRVWYGLEHTDIECNDSDREKWTPLSCNILPHMIKASTANGFGIDLTGVPFYSDASYEFTVSSGRDRAETWVISVELVAAEVVGFEPRPVIRRTPGRRSPR